MHNCNCRQYLGDIGLLVLRVSIGHMMSFGHGLGKVSKYFSGSEIQFPDPIGLGSKLSFFLVGTTEFFISLILVMGLFTRFAVLPLIFTMLVAAFVVHGAGSFSEKEMALLYLFPFITLLLTGPGKISLDYLIKLKFCKRCD